MNFESAGATWVDSWGFGDQASVRSTRAAKVKLKYKYKVKYNDKHKEELRLRLCFNRSSPSLLVPVDDDPVLEFLRQISNKNNSFISHSYNYNMQEDHTYDDLHEDLSLSCLTVDNDLYAHLLIIPQSHLPLLGLHPHPHHLTWTSWPAITLDPFLKSNSFLVSPFSGRAALAGSSALESWKRRRRNSCSRDEKRNFKHF